MKRIFYYCPGINTMDGFCPENSDGTIVLYESLAKAQTSLAVDISEWFRQVTKGQRTFAEAWAGANDCNVIAVLIDSKGVAWGYDRAILARYDLDATVHLSIAFRAIIDYGFLQEPPKVPVGWLGFDHMVQRTIDRRPGGLSPDERALLEGEGDDT